MKSDLVDLVSLSDRIKDKHLLLHNSATGYIHLTEEKEGQVKTLESRDFDFYITPTQTVMIVYFEKEGDKLPAAGLVVNRAPPAPGQYEIESPFDNPYGIVGMFGTSLQPGHVASNGWGKGLLKLEKITAEPSYNYMKGSFSFIQKKNSTGEMAKIVVREFWAEYNWPA